MTAERFRLYQRALRASSVSSPGQTGGQSEGIMNSVVNVIKWTVSIALLTGLAATVQAQGDCDLKQLDVGTASGRPGEQVQVDIVGGVSCEISGFSLAVGHSVTDLLFIDAVPGQFVAVHAGADLFFTAQADDIAGYSVIGAVFDLSFPLTVPATTIDADTVIAVVTYEILDAASTGDTALLNRTLTFGPPGGLVSNVYAGKPLEPPIEPNLVDGLVTVLESTPFQRGDANSDADIDVSDGVYILRYLFSGNAEPPCLKSLDTNDGGSVDVSDAVFLLNHLFASGDAPPAPYTECGQDTTRDELTCASSPCV